MHSSRRTAVSSTDPPLCHSLKIMFELKRPWRKSKQKELLVGFVFNELWYRKEYRQLMLKPSSLGGPSGRGMFSPFYIPKGCYVGLYDGVVAGDSETEASQSDGILKLQPGYNVDGAHHGNWMYYINDNKDKKRINLEINCLGMLKTVKTILPGDEMFVSYGDDYWKDKTMI